MELLRLAGQGLSSSVIAERLGRTQATISWRKSVLRKARAAAPVVLVGDVKKSQRVTVDQALGWANQRGLCNDGRLNIAVVNAKRVELGLSAFDLVGGARA